MPAIFINPTTEEHLNLLNRLKEQNQDLRVFISDKIEKDFVEKLPGKKAASEKGEKVEYSPSVYLYLVAKKENLSLNKSLSSSNKNILKALVLLRPPPLNILALNLLVPTKD